MLKLQLRIAPALAGLLLLLPVLSGKAHATLIDSGNAVMDSASGLEWLKESLTLGDSPNTALANNPGYQLATWSQVQTLLKDVGIPASHINTNSYYLSDLAAGNALDVLLNKTLAPWESIYGPSAVDYELYVFGNVLDASNNGWDQVQIDVRNSPLTPKGTYTEFNAFNNCFDCSTSNNFDFLVRQTAAVPEPASLAILGTALAGLGLMRRRKRA